LKLHLHPVQQHSADPIVGQSSFDSQTGTLVVPALTHGERKPRTLGRGKRAVNPVKTVIAVRSQLMYVMQHELRTDQHLPQQTAKGGGGETHEKDRHLNSRTDSTHSR
jgi:hypothetical protein